MSEKIDCAYCHNRGFFFFWENNPRRQMWKKECPHCGPTRQATKKPPPKRINENVIEFEL